MTVSLANFRPIFSALLVISCFLARYATVAQNDWQRIYSGPLRRDRRSRPPEALVEARDAERLDVHGVALIAAEAHDVAALVSADDLDDMPSAIAQHGR